MEKEKFEFNEKKAIEQQEVKDLEQMLLEGYKKDKKEKSFNFRNRISELRKYFKKEYSEDRFNFRLYHVFGDSTVDKNHEDSIKHDFDGHDSVIKNVEKILNEPEWEQAIERREEVKEKYREMYKIKYGDYYTKITDFGQKLQRKYSDNCDYLLYHAVAGSSTPGYDKDFKNKYEDKQYKFDFFGKDSVEDFIEDLHKKFKEEEKA